MMKLLPVNCMLKLSDSLTSHNIHPWIVQFSQHQKYHDLNYFRIHLCHFLIKIWQMHLPQCPFIVKTLMKNLRLWFHHPFKSRKFKKVLNNHLFYLMCLYCLQILWQEVNSVTTFSLFPHSHNLR